MTNPYSTHKLLQLRLKNTSGKWEGLTGTRTHKTAFLHVFTVIFGRKFILRVITAHSSLEQELWKLEQPKKSKWNM